MNRLTKTLALATAALAASCSSGDAGSTATGAQAMVAGAGYTTFDASLGGCLDSPNGVNCNHYQGKVFVYMSGGPTRAGLSDGDYFFAVLAPGYQNGGFLDGAEGNLSDTFAGGTDGDLGSGDGVANRTFSVASHGITAYGGTHAMGTSPNGKPIIALAPFDDTDNPGGVYVLAICAVGAAGPSDCKYDAFRIAAGEGPRFATVSGAKYYDANTNGQYDPGEPFLAGWPIGYTDAVSGVIPTEADGTFRVELTADAYRFWEVLPLAGSTWTQTGNLVSQAAASDGASVALAADKTYALTVADGSTVTGLYFGNVCLGAGGGHTLGFWSNRNGQALFGADDLRAMDALDLRDAAGASFDPATYAAFRTWLLNATATNMAYMLSAQLAAMDLNILNGFVDPAWLAYAPGTSGANANGFVTVGGLVAEADASLAAYGYTPAGSPERAHQEALKTALDSANNDRTFVQPTPATCPAPVFP
jgi:hypothetical protein